jgi:hypothetical protein
MAMKDFVRRGARSRFARRAIFAALAAGLLPVGAAAAAMPGIMQSRAAMLAADSTTGTATQPQQPPGASPGTETAPAESPSQKLSKSRGVIHPPPTNDHSVVTPPPSRSSGKAVIAPPGAPGGNPNVEPK